MRNLIYTELLSAYRRLPNISDNEEIGTSINFIKNNSSCLALEITEHTLTLYDTSVHAYAQ